GHYHLKAEGTGRQEGLARFVGFGILCVLPIAWNMVESIMGGLGEPYEVQLTLVLRNLTIGAAALRLDGRSQRLAVLGSLFLVIFGFMWCPNVWSTIVLFAYAFCAMWWLMAGYWGRIQASLHAESERAIPVVPAVTALAIAGFLLMVACLVASDARFTTALYGFMPSSGGTRWRDDRAWGGVGDGAQMVSAKEQASSFGPIESELFLESKMPSLYDVFNEMSESTQKIKKNRSRAIPLSPSQMQMNHQRRGVNKKAGREFNAVRQKREKKSINTDDQDSPALLQVVGRVPLHLGLYAYDQWDGHNLSSSNSSPKVSLYFDKTSNVRRTWIRPVGIYADNVFRRREEHQVRIINLKESRIPAPANLSGVDIDKIHTPRMFTGTPDGMLAADMEFIPQLTVIHVETLMRHRDDVPALHKTESSEGELDAIGRLAREWTAGVEAGWPQVAEVCRRLRTEYVLDPEEMVPQEVDDAAEHFLLNSRRGPDYLFAASTAVLLRSLGYETRVISGFYARRENYNRQARLTSVYKNDAHFWVQVLTERSDYESLSDEMKKGIQPLWVTVEPSPGYDLLYATEPLMAGLWRKVLVGCGWVVNHPVTSISTLAALLGAWFYRTTCGDIAVTIWWLFRYQVDDLRSHVKSTLRLLERRAFLHGCRRAPGTTLDRWSLTPAMDTQSAEAAWAPRFITLANWAVFGDGVPASMTREEVREVCLSAASHGLSPSSLSSAWLNVLLSKESE
ncbi:MAG: transglutaminase domain-containing protein, partial [Planctomycetota bacterium]